MSNLNNRIKQLEEKAGISDVNKYMCVIVKGWAYGWDTPEERAKGYKIQPLFASAGGVDKEPFYLATETELDEFAARHDVELITIHVGFEDQDARGG